jgi:hypothetical protein
MDDTTGTSALIAQWENSGRLDHRIAASLARQITTGQLRPYADLPPDTALMRQHTVSRGTIGNAKRLLAAHGLLLLELSRLVVAPGHAPQPPAPARPPALTRRMTRDYAHLVLKFSPPPVSQSGRHEATWADGDGVTAGEATADTEPELIAKVLDALGDCGDDKHTWVEVDRARHPLDPGRSLLTQRLNCPYCDPRARVLTDPPYRPTLVEKEYTKQRAS